MREYNVVYNHELYKRHSRVTKKKHKSRASGPGRMGPQTVNRLPTLPLPHSDQQLGESTRSKLHDLDMRI